MFMSLLTVIGIFVSDVALCIARPAYPLRRRERQVIEMNADPQPLKHFVSEEPFDPYSVEVVSPEQERLFLASQWRMMWLRFKKHRVAVAAAVVLVLMYLSILVVEFLAPL